MSIARIKKCLTAKIPWEYKCGVLVFRDGKFKACIIIDNESPEDKKIIFSLLNMPYDTSYYTDKEVSAAMEQLFESVLLTGTLTCKAPAFRSNPISGLETRNKLIQRFTQKLSSLEQKYVRKHIPKVINVHNLLMQLDWTHCSELEDIENKLNKVIRKYFSSVIKLDKDSCYTMSLEAFIVALKNY
jgi:hypothetical protein